MYQYAIIDSSQRPHFYERLERMGVQYRSLFDQQAEENLNDIAPLLVEYTLGQTSPKLVKEIEQLGANKPAVSLLDSSLRLDELAKHFEAFHLIKVLDQVEREMLLRWYDTRILPVWRNVLTPAQSTAFLGGIHCWRYFDRFGGLQELAPPEPHMDELPSLLPLRLDQAQYKQLLEACEPDVAIAQLRRVIPDEMRRIPRQVLHPFITQHLMSCKAHGVQQLDDHVQYLLLAIYTSGECHRHSAVIDRFSHTCDAWPMSFSEWIAGLPEDIWATGAPIWDAELKVEGS